MWINTFCYSDSPHIFYTSQKGLMESLQLHLRMVHMYVCITYTYVHIGVYDIVSYICIHMYSCMYYMYLGIACVEYNIYDFNCFDPCVVSVKMNPVNADAVTSLFCNSCTSNLLRKCYLIWCSQPMHTLCSTLPPLLGGDL